MVQAKPGGALERGAGLASWASFEGDDPAPRLGHHPARVTLESTVYPSIFLRDGWTRGGSPGIFGKFGGYGASPRPFCSSRSTHSSSTRRSQTVSSIADCTSPSSAKR